MARLTFGISAEKIVGKWFAHTGRRSDVFLAASFGSYDPDKPISSGPAPDSSAAHMHKCIARSLEALQTNYVDIFYQGRVDPKIPIEVVLENLREYVDKGVIRWLGLSECSAEVLGRAKAVPGLGEKVVAVQREYGPFELGIEKDEFLQAAKELGVTLIAYSPLHRGLATGRQVKGYSHKTSGFSHLFADSAPRLTSRRMICADSSPGSPMKTCPRTLSWSISWQR